MMNRRQVVVALTLSHLAAILVGALVVLGVHP